MAREPDPDDAPDRDYTAYDDGFAALLNGLTLGGQTQRPQDPRRPDGPRHAAPEPRHALPDPHEDEEDEGPGIVRAYAWTGGRTRSDYPLQLETLVSTTEHHPRHHAHLPAEHHAIVEICRQTRSVAEVAALLSVPLGIAKVLVGDLAGRGLLTIHQTATGTGADGTPAMSLMERVLSGLRRL